eukprot:COSAG01_NODE_21499_length_899_cov_1.912500_1_plen_156_part_00
MYSTAHPPVIAVICTINIVRVHCRYDHRGDPGDLDWHGEHVNVVEDDTALKSIAVAQLNDLTPRTSRKHKRAAGKTWRQGLYDSVRAGLVAAAVLASPLCSPSSQSPSAPACAAAAASRDCGGGAAPLPPTLTADLPFGEGVRCVLPPAPARAVP